MIDPRPTVVPGEPGLLTKAKGFFVDCTHELARRFLAWCASAPDLVVGVFFAGLDSRSTHLQTRPPVSGQNGVGDQREEVGFREKVPLVPVVGKAAEIERAVLP